MRTATNQECNWTRKMNKSLEETFQHPHIPHSFRVSFLCVCARIHRLPLAYFISFSSLFSAVSGMFDMYLSRIFWFLRHLFCFSISRFSPSFSSSVSFSCSIHSFTRQLNVFNTRISRDFHVIPTLSIFFFHTRRVKRQKKKKGTERTRENDRRLVRRSFYIFRNLSTRPFQFQAPCLSCHHTIDALFSFSPMWFFYTDTAYKTMFFIQTLLFSFSSREENISTSSELWLFFTFNFGWSENLVRLHWQTFLEVFCS